MKARFITLEGGEGTGKSTQAKALARAIEARGVTAVLTREPGGTSGAEAIREMLLGGTDERWNIRSEALLFAAARADHVKRLIKPAIARGDWVICDRFLDSSRAYQVATGELLDDQIMALHDIGSGGFLPDLTFVLDLPDEIAMQRAQARDRGDSDRIGGRDASYHKRVMQNFRDFSVKDPERVKLIEANNSVEMVTAQIIDHLTDWLD